MMLNCQCGGIQVILWVFGAVWGRVGTRKKPSPKKPGALFVGFLGLFQMRFEKAHFVAKILGFFTWWYKTLLKLSWFLFLELINSKILNSLFNYLIIFFNHLFKSLQYSVFLMVLSFISNFSSFDITCYTNCLQTTISINDIFLEHFIINAKE